MIPFLKNKRIKWENEEKITVSDQPARVNLSDVHESIFHMECFLKILCQLADMPEAGYLGLALLKDLKNKLDVMNK